MILINCLSALQGGGQTYLLHLFAHVPQHIRDQIIILTPAQTQHLWAKFGLRMITGAWASKSIFHRVIFEQVEIPEIIRREHITVYFAPGGTVLLRKMSPVKTVTMFRNMLPFAPEERRRYPLGYMRFRLWVLRFVMAHSFQQADQLIVLSRYCQQVLDQALPRRLGKTAIIPHGVGDAFRYQPERPLPERISGEYVLYVSTLDVYKAQLEVIQAWYHLRQQRKTSEKLVLIGPAYPYYAKKVKTLIHRLHLENEVILLGKVPYEELPCYYQNAKINLFASSCETFGMTLLEKLAAGKPVFCSHYPTFQELAGDTMEYFDPYIPEELTNLLLKYLDDESLRAELGKKALQQSQRFDWKGSADRTWQLLAELLEAR